MIIRLTNNLRTECLFFRKHNAKYANPITKGPLVPSKNKKNKRLDKKIRKFAKNKDFLFLNDVFLPIDNTQAIIIDNIIFGNKYIYITKEVKQAGKWLYYGTEQAMKDFN